MPSFCLPYGDTSLEVRVPAGTRLSVLSPNRIHPAEDPAAELANALRNPIGLAPLRRAAHGAKKVVILADDLTRRTPVHEMIPLVLDELNEAGVPDSSVQVLIALGTHRPMSPAEIETRFGQDVLDRVSVANCPWDDPTRMTDLGTTPNGTPVWIATQAVEADFLIGLGSIVPHHIAGFSGGAKIVQPGISGAVTTGATHFFSTRTRRSYLGFTENPVRAEMESIADQIGLRAVFNTVLDGDGRLIKAYFGDPRVAFRAGVELSRRVFGVALDGLADIVVAGSHPCDIEFWQAHKSLYPADLIAKEGGTVIVVTPCPEGVSVSHREVLDYARLGPGRIEEGIESGLIRNVVAGALALAWSKMTQRNTVSLVSDGIEAEEARALGFVPFNSLEEALADALQRHGAGARVVVLTHAPEMLPIVRGS